MGPPGSGKTTLANIIAATTSSYFSPVSAVSAGVADLRKTIEEAKERRGLTAARPTVHRRDTPVQQGSAGRYFAFRRDGTVTLIGATTENPSFEVISPLLSRAQVFVLKPLTGEEIRIIIFRAIKDSLRGLGAFNPKIEDDALDYLITMSNNDARTALNTLETAVLNTPPDADGKRNIRLSTIEDTVQHRALSYDKSGEKHYDTISALHKSMRGSDPDASLYWLGRND